MNIIIFAMYGITLLLFLAGNATLVVAFTEKDMQMASARNMQAVAFFLSTLAWLAIATVLTFIANTPAFR